MVLKVLELFSGIGGMHYALEYSQLSGEVVAAIDINTVANNVYKHNHVETCVFNNNIQRLNAKFLNDNDIHMLLMSPPCQPHTRNGQKRDLSDPRSEALHHICTILQHCKSLQYVLLENVKGFELSQSRNIVIEAMNISGFFWREFILSPTQVGVPNTRNRYYLIARKNMDFTFTSNNLWERLPFEPNNGSESKIPPIESILEPEDSVPTSSYLPEKILRKYVWLLDIVTASATNTMCFTKAYTHYSEGTGSVYSALSAKEIHDTFAQLKINGNENNIELLKKLQLRYFTPREVARLMCFPESFFFPENTSTRQQYRLLGNSINVRVVGELIKLLCIQKL